MTYPNLDDTKATDGPANETTEEIEITPAMIEAGVEEVRLWDAEGGDLHALVRFIYGAMRPLEPAANIVGFRHTA